MSKIPPPPPKKKSERVKKNFKILNSFVLNCKVLLPVPAFSSALTATGHDTQLGAFSFTFVTDTVNVWVAVGLALVGSLGFVAHTSNVISVIFS